MLKAKVRRQAVQDMLFRRSISQNNLAQRLGVSSGYFSQLMTGGRCPGPGLRQKMMRELKVDFDSLFEPVR
jgi:transcriptional regulator with XRE-family HTH domain